MAGVKGPRVTASRTARGLSWRPGSLPSLPGTLPVQRPSSVPPPPSGTAPTSAPGTPPTDLPDPDSYNNNIIIIIIYI